MQKYIPHAIVLFYIILANGFFGWNFAPKSPEELICDGIGIVMILMIVLSNKIKKV